MPPVDSLMPKRSVTRSIRLAHWNDRRKSFVIVTCFSLTVCGRRGSFEFDSVIVSRLKPRGSDTSSNRKYLSGFGTSAIAR